MQGKELKQLTIRAAAVFLLAAFLLSGVSREPVRSQEQPLYKNPRAAIDDRVRDLLGRMTLEEKVAQLTGVWMTKPQTLAMNFADPNRDLGDFSPEKAAKVFPNGIGQIARQRENKTPRGSAEFANSVQKWLVEKTRLGIPAVFHDEILHGNMARGSTVFPTPLAMAASWDTELIGRVFTAGALETRVRGSQHVLGPNLDLARDPRWGRTEETYGEDPYLASRFAVAVVKALQGGANNRNPAIDADHVIATGKHFVGHGQPEGGTNIAPVNLSERLLRETHLKTFEAAIKEGGLQSIMPAYHEIDGVPVHANKYFLDTILRGQFGFEGVVVSDYGAIHDLVTRHHVAVDKSDAARQALEAGVDIELPDPDTYATLVEQVKSGKISEETLNKAVARVLRSKFQLGLFENPYVDPEKAEKIVDSPAHRALALDAARRSIILLKNEKSLLPLDRAKLKSIAVIGPNAARAHLGGYTDPQPARSVSLLEGVKNKLGDAVKVNYAEGVKITKEGGDWFGNKATLNDEESDRKLIAEAVETAKNSDAVILSIGGNEDTNKEAWAENHLGDRDSLELVGRQNELVRAVLATGKPTVVFLTNSGPLAINYVAENAPAILEGFYLGEEGGTAAADVIFGDYNPGGKLPVSFPRTTGQLPVYYNQKPSAKRGYLFTTTGPLFPFGYGLSYTTFKYSDLTIEKKQIAPDGETSVSVKVTNTGARAGDEVVQLYIRDEVSSVTRPVKELRDFARVALAPGETKSVVFKITPEKLSFYNREMKRTVEPGAFQVMVGGNSADLLTEKFEVVEK
ncbi:MAG: glycoside hydrolase family 3 C-terminal domain-containing protein [Acidobacteria bacterium]|nr:glycoside hydrolase family 3 C-terminal domain-containing protein [Acidobacteriota bacterium]